MTTGVEQLARLLPAILRIRDLAEGQLVKARVAPDDERQAEDFGPLKTLLSVLAREGRIVEEELDQLYDDAFIETCARWVIPYLGDLVGVRGLAEASDLVDLRGLVANALPLRQRKGTLRAIEQAAIDASAWPVVAVEYNRRLVISQSMRHIRPNARATVDLRDEPALARANGPFERFHHSVEVRRIASGRGRWNAPNIGLHVWRLVPYSVTRHQVEPLAPGERRFRFDPLGADAPLFHMPPPRGGIDVAMTEHDTPAPIGRLVMREALGTDDTRYGNGLSVTVYQLDGDGAFEAIPEGEIRVCHLGDRGDPPVPGAEPDWNRTPEAARTLIDPVLGRMVLDAERDGEVWVAAHFGRMADIGGGEHDRSETADLPTAPEPPAPAADHSFAPGDEISIPAGEAGLALLEATGPYSMTEAIDVPAGETLRIVAQDGAFPTVDLGTGVTVTLGEGASVELNGLRCLGGPLAFEGTPESIHLIDCTCVPGRRLDRLGTATEPGAVSVEIGATGTSFAASRSILGPVSLAADVDARFEECIIDAGSASVLAVGPPVPTATGQLLCFDRCTVVGRVVASAFFGEPEEPVGPVDIAPSGRPRPSSDTIFFAEADGEAPPISVAFRQTGCLRFCYVPPGARAPRLYRCVREPAPEFLSRRYGDPSYLVLAKRVPETILRGAESGGEIGVWNRVAAQARTDNIARTIEDFIRFGMEGGVLCES